MWQIYERKVIVLTLVCLIFWKYPGYENASSDIRVKYQKSAESIVVTEIMYLFM